MTAPGWAKYAADDIVSDDDIDDATSKKSDSRDWLKWALGIGLLGAGAYGAYKYSPEIKQQLGSLKLFSSKTPVNKAVEAATAGATSSPGVLGAGLGLAAASPIGAALSRSRTFNGNMADLTTLEGQGRRVPTNVSNVRTETPMGQQTNQVAEQWTAASHSATPRNWSLDAQKPGSAIAELARLHKPGATPGPLAKDTGFAFFGGHRQARRETQDLINNLRAEGAKLNAPVTYVDPVTKANVTKPLVEIEIGDPALAPALKLTPEQIASWDRHRRAFEASEVGKTPAGGKPPAKTMTRAQFDFDRHATALETSQRIAKPGDWGGMGRNALGYGLGGGILGHVTNQIMGY